MNGQKRRREERKEEKEKEGANYVESKQERLIMLRKKGKTKEEKIRTEINVVVGRE